eukprot:TRINITY_DN3025_c0_g1_i1.p1 TRINITY_DN3025_c0_g1~~TRINITY_DN3025_c0_g1_i1.p1  ORF type:complete len:453 (+),score=111.49 TRINITY_DN3025_c0_g1_i1:78-1436(+)
MAAMTQEAIDSCIAEYDGYRQPLLNDQLFLHCKGFMEISKEIGKYKNVKALWLQQNALSKIENLELCPELGCVYLHQNCIKKISGLDKLVNLHTLNLSQNYITKIEGLENLPNLETLMLAHNRLSTLQSLEGILACKTVSCLDISHNGLSVDKEAGEDPDDVIKLLQQLPVLACLYIQNNELPNQTRYFRRKMIGTIKTLTYMDERPVFPEDRRTIDAWMIGGFEAEDAERDLIREEKKAAEKASLQKYKEMQERGRAMKEQREAELALLEEQRLQWMADNKVVHEQERQVLVAEEYEARKLEKEQANEHQEQLDQLISTGLASSLKQERDRLERLRIEQEVRDEIEREEKERDQRLQEYKKRVNEERLSRDQELQFIDEELNLMTIQDEKALAKQQSELQFTDPMSGMPTETKISDVAPPTKVASVPPSKTSYSKKTSVWEKYASLERKFK